MKRHLFSLFAVVAVLGAIPSSGLADHEPDLGTEAMTILVPGYSQGYTESTLDSRLRTDDHPRAWLQPGS